MAKYEYYPRFGPENHSYVAPYEQTFDVERSTEWMQQNWGHSFSLSLLYIVAIFAVQRYMRTRRPLLLDQALFWWNLALATFSAIGAARMVPELFWAVGSNSFTYSICTASYAQGITGFWTEKFAMSKVLEFVDTAFIVLRKKPLIFLHWYHHVTVLIYTWMLYKDHTASGRWFVSMNYTVHAVMYTYYALRARRFVLPKSAAMLITLMQIAQMVVGVFIGIVTYRLKTGGVECQHTWTNLHASFLIYFTYFLLFCNFFYQTYMRPGNRYSSASGGGKKGGGGRGNGTMANGRAANGELLVTANGDTDEFEQMGAVAVSSTDLIGPGPVIS